MENFKEKKRSLLADMQMQQLHCEIMQTKLANKKAAGAPDVKYCADFQNDLEKHSKNMKKTVQLMQKFCANAEAVNAKALPGLMDACEQLAAKHKDIEHWAEKFGESLPNCICGSTSLNSSVLISETPVRTGPTPTKTSSGR